jgi:autophagy-related protein 17
MCTKATVHSLDTASARLNRTLNALRGTLVEASFRPPSDTAEYLFDFVDEAGIAEMENSIKASIDGFEVARSTLAQTCESFEQDLRSLHGTLQAPAEENEIRVEEVDGISPVPGLFYALETRATETATHLEGLVRHYDLCVTALKHTEGGGEAISQASDGEQSQQASALAGLGVDLGKVDEAPPQPMSEDERTNMLAVLVKDAGEVDDVVVEMKDGLAEMEDQLVEIVSYVQTLRDASLRLKTALELLKHVAANVPAYITACADFQMAWEEERAVLTEKMEGLEGLRDFYAGFADAYDGLIVEVQRRKRVKREMEKVIEGAMVELEALYQGMLLVLLVLRSILIRKLAQPIWKNEESFKATRQSIYQATYGRVLLTRQRASRLSRLMMKKTIYRISKNRSLKRRFRG